VAVTGGLRRGDLVWVDLDPTAGREQRGRRPAVVVSSDDYLASVRGLVVVLPLTTTDRGWPHHVRVVAAGLRKTSFVMTEQPRTVSAERIVRRLGRAAASTMRDVDMWLADFLGLSARA